MSPCRTRLSAGIQGTHHRKSGFHLAVSHYILYSKRLYKLNLLLHCFFGCPLFTARVQHRFGWDVFEFFAMRKCKLLTMLTPFLQMSWYGVMSE